MNQNPTSNIVWEEQLGWFKEFITIQTLDTFDGEPMEFEWNIFPGFTTLQLINKVGEFMSRMSDPSQFKGRIIFMSIFNDILWESEDNERECNANAEDDGNSSDLDQKRSGILLVFTDHKEKGTESLNRR